MSVVVEQTIPWPLEELGLDNPNRWNNLFPLIRPSVTPVKTGKGQTVLLDRALANNKFVQIAAIGKPGNFPAKFLSDKHITAIVTDTSGAGILTGKDLLYTLQSHGIKTTQGLVVVAAGKRRKLAPVDVGVIEIETEGELEFDQVLSLLENSSETARTSIHETSELLKMFLKTAVCTKSALHTDKQGKNASIVQGSGHAEFETIKKALAKDLTQVLRSHSTQDNSNVFSVHYSNVNGLSQLENYILAYEISSYLDEQSIPYRISSSTLTDDNLLSSRGWAISIATIPRQFLAPQAKPSNDLSQDRLERTDSVTTPAPASRMTFVDSDVRTRLTAGCQKVISSEPAITEYDTIVGDGDCGITLRDGATKVIEFTKDRDLAQLPQALSDLVDDLEVTMGGTSGALYCIFLSSLSNSLRTTISVPEALTEALAQLMNYTRARKGDRTCLDCLIPFVQVLAEGGDAGKAVQAARMGVRRTETMEAKLGRSAYLDERATRGVPDPGAYGLLKLLEGLCGA